MGSRQGQEIEEVLDIEIIRALFGCLDEYPKLKREVIATLEHDWCRNNAIHFCLGTANRDLLLSCGAQNVTMISDRSSIAPAGYSKWYNKICLIQRAMEEFDEILYLDFDTGIVRNPDCRLLELLRSKEGRFHGEFQAPNVGYVRPVCPFRDKRYPRRKCLNACFIYCASKRWINDILAAYDHYNARFGTTAPDETIIMYYLDMTFGIMDFPTMVSCFEPSVIRLRRGIPEAQETKSDSDVYFVHR